MLRSLCAACWLSVALAAVGVAAYGAGNVRIGVFAVRYAGGLEANDLAKDVVLTATTDALVSDLQAANLGEIVPLAWPEALKSGDRPTFETLVGRGAEAGCNGVLAVEVSALSFTVKEMNIPLLGSVNKADAAVKLTGGLVDVASAAAVAPVNAAATDGDRKYDGPSPQDAVGDADTLAKTPLGKALVKARRQVLEAVKGGVGKLSGAPPPLPSRAKAPDGVGFARDSYNYDFVPGFDLRGVVAVVNRGTAPQAFIVKPLRAPQNVVVGLAGEGSVDGPCTLQPGQWKFVRLVVTAPQAVEDANVKLGLYVADAGQTPQTDKDPTDEALTAYHWLSSQAGVRLEVLGQDPVTLAYKCQLVNQSAEETARLEFAAADIHQALLVRLEPAVTGTELRPKASLTFSVVPFLTDGMKSMDVALKGNCGSENVSHTFHFEIPPGKHVYYGFSHTGESSGSGAGFCTNGGGGDMGVGGAGDAPPPPTPGDEEAARKKIEKILKQARDRSQKWDAEHPGERGHKYIPPVAARQASTIRPSVAGRKGATIRSNVAARLPELGTDSTFFPMVARGKDTAGLLWYVPAANGGTSVCFAPIMWAGDEGATWPDIATLNESGHSGRWPDTRGTPYDSRAFVVWEDSVPGRGSDVAFRASGDHMQNWGQVQYLTSHGKGVDDPVVAVGEQPTVAVVWGDLRSGTRQLYLRLSADGGATFAPEVALPRAAGEDDYWPQAAFNGSGNLALVYVSAVGGQARVMSRMLDHQGAPMGEPVALSHPGVSCGEPHVACAADGRLLAVWREGEGSASEVWFAGSPGAGRPWGAPVQVTNDNAYSEYPVVGAIDNIVWVAYGSDINGLTDLTYVKQSTDGGQTWSEAVAQPSLEDVAGPAWVEVNFSLQWPRNVYHPHSTYIYVNGTEVGRLENTVPEGTYVFPVPVGVVSSGATGPRPNRISFKIEGMNHADYVVAAQCRLIVSRRFTQLPVVAASQAEADRLAPTCGVGLNHDRADLVLCANLTGGLSDRLQAGQSVPVKLQVRNLGEAPATGVRVGLYTADPRDPLADLSRAKLAEQTLGVVKPGESREVPLSFKFDPRRTSRVYAVVRGNEEDAWPEDNTWALSFTAGESKEPTPLLGTDIPNVFAAPQLATFVSLPNVPALQDLIALPDFGSLDGIRGIQLPSLSDLEGAIQSGIGGAGVTVPDLGDLLHR